MEALACTLLDSPPSITVAGAGGAPVSLLDSVNDMVAYTKLDDGIFGEI